MLDVPAARALLAKTRPVRMADGYPPQIRQRVTELAHRLVSEGQSVSQVSRRLGLHVSTVGRWLEGSAEAEPSFVPVEVAAEADAAAAPTSGLCVVSPGGFRLEGLGFEEAIVALSRLG